MSFRGFQGRVARWCIDCMGIGHATDTRQRNHRFLEEALELVQSCGCTKDDAHLLVDYVFNRPVGHPPQEVGGTMTTLAILCANAGIDMIFAAETEYARISRPEVMAKIRAKQASKPSPGPLPGTTPTMREFRDTCHTSGSDEDFR